MKATISKLIFEADLTENRIKELIMKYGKQIGIGLDYYKDELKGEGKKYCFLIFIKGIEPISPKKYKKKKGNRLAWFTEPKIF